MIDMSYEEVELKDFSVPQMNTPKYPHGLRISLGKEEIKKLNLEGIPEIGKKYKVEIEVEVIEVSLDTHDNNGDEKSHRVELQIKEMEFKKDKTEEMIDRADSAQIIYGE